jgi:riboflavin synthase
MFTGIVEEIGTVVRVDDRGGDVRLRIEAGLVPSDLAIGDSVSVSGCCLTAVIVDASGFEVELSKETIAKTAPRWTEGARVNLERALQLGGRLGGHVVSGHVEGVGAVTEVRREPGAFVITVRAPERLARYLIPKGSVTVDGVSLTVVDLGGPAGSTAALDACTFTLWLIPHTLDVTTLGELAPGSHVNLETDMFAKYAERLVGMTELARAPRDLLSKKGPIHDR